MFCPGDIIGFSGRGFISDLVNVFTYGIPRWGISHVGIVTEYQHRLILVESTTLDDEPCLILGKKIHGVQAHPLNTRIGKYAGKIFHYPLIEELSDEQSRELTKFLITMLGRSYDELGAFRAGGVGFSHLEGLLHKESLHAIFCSELCAAAHRQVGILDTENVSHYNPNHLIRWELFKKIISKPIRLK